jgi:hypothetical protein
MSPNIPSDNRALSVLSLKSNSLGWDGGKALAEGLKGNQVITELNIAGNTLGWNASGFEVRTSLKTTGNTLGWNQRGKVHVRTCQWLRLHGFTGVVDLADVMPDMRAMTSLNLASNKLGVEDAKIVAACLPKCT